MRQLKINLTKCDGGRNCAHECEEACATRVFKLDDPKGAALHIEALADGESSAILCDQCGDCVTVCAAEALRRNKLGVVMIDKKLCVGCNVHRLLREGRVQSQPGLAGALQVHGLRHLRQGLPPRGPGDRARSPCRHPGSSEARTRP